MKYILKPLSFVEGVNWFVPVQDTILFDAGRYDSNIKLNSVCMLVVR